MILGGDTNEKAKKEIHCSGSGIYIGYVVLWFCFANLGAFDLSPAYRHPFCVCYLPPSGEVLFDAFIPVLLAKFRGEETFAFVFVAALFAFVTNAPAFVPLFDEPPTKRTRKSKHLLKSNPSYIIGRAKILKTRHTGKETREENHES